MANKNFLVGRLVKLFGRKDAKSNDLFQLRQQCLDSKVLFEDPQVECIENATNQSKIEKQWNMNAFEGAWFTGISAGRFINHPTFHRNPQFMLNITKPVDDAKETCTVVVALMQKHRYGSMEKKSVHIGFSIYGMEDSDLTEKPQIQAFFYGKTLKFQTEKYERVCDVTKRIELPPGRYLIVPSTLEPDKNAEFLIRVSTECRQTFEEYDNTVFIGELDILISMPQDNSICTKQFEKHKNSSGEIGWKELQRIFNDPLVLVTGKETKIFSENLCRSMVAMLDTDYSRKLRLAELQALFFEIGFLKDAFKLLENDNSCGLDIVELREAFASIDYHLNNQILNSIVYRYGSDDNTIALEDFILCAVKIRTMLQHITKRDVGNENEATFFLDEWIISSMNC